MAGRRGKATKQMSPREQLLVVVLAVSLIVAAYVVYRVPSLKREAALTQEQLDRLEREVRLARPSGNVSQSGSLKADVERLRQRLEQERSTLAGFRNAFVDLSNNDALPALLAEITRQAEIQGLQVVDRQNLNNRLDQVLELDRRARQLTRAATAGAGTRANGVAYGGASRTGSRRSARQSAQARAAAERNRALQLALRRDEPLLNRPSFRFEFRGDFTSLYRFIEAIHALDAGTVITNVDVGAENTLMVGGRGRLLSATLTIAL